MLSYERRPLLILFRIVPFGKIAFREAESTVPQFVVPVPFVWFTYPVFSNPAAS